MFSVLVAYCGFTQTLTIIAEDAWDAWSAATERGYEVLSVDEKE